MASYMPIIRSGGPRNFSLSDEKDKDQGKVYAETRFSERGWGIGSGKGAVALLYYEGPRASPP